jgi:hypothetical protein
MLSLRCVFVFGMQVVPTMDTVRFTYLLKTQLTFLNSVFFTGITGTGKTVIASDFLNTASSMDYDAGVQVRNNWIGVSFSKLPCTRQQ